jgi:hypothetical protein
MKIYSDILSDKTPKKVGSNLIGLSSQFPLLSFNFSKIYTC